MNEMVSEWADRSFALAQMLILLVVVSCCWYPQNTLRLFGNSFDEMVAELDKHQRKLGYSIRVEHPI